VHAEAGGISPAKANTWANNAASKVLTVEMSRRVPLIGQVDLGNIELLSMWTPQWGGEGSASLNAHDVFCMQVKHEEASAQSRWMELLNRLTHDGFAADTATSVGERRAAERKLLVKLQKLKRAIGSILNWGMGAA